MSIFENKFTILLKLLACEDIGNYKLFHTIYVVWLSFLYDWQNLQSVRQIWENFRANFIHFASFHQKAAERKSQNTNLFFKFILFIFTWIQAVRGIDYHQIMFKRFIGWNSIINWYWTQIKTIENIQLTIIRGQINNSVIFSN